MHTNRWMFAHPQTCLWPGKPHLAPDSRREGRAGWSRSLHAAGRLQEPWAPVSRTAGGRNHRGFNIVCLSFGKQRRCEWGVVPKRYKSLCAHLWPRSCHAILMSHLPKAVLHLPVRKVTTWGTESWSAAERGLREGLGICNLCHFQELREWMHGFNLVYKPHSHTGQWGKLHELHKEKQLWRYLRWACCRKRAYTGFLFHLCLH